VVGSVTGTPPTASVAAGQAVQLTATVLDTAGNSLAGFAVAWSSGNTAAAMVDSNGLVSGVAAGSATITATSGGKSGTSVITVTATAANQSPNAAFTSSCTSLACSFTDGSTDPDGQVVGWSWTFGDGATSSSTAPNPSHTYAAAGTYTVTVTVTDNLGATGSISHTVTVSAANQSPTAAFTSSCNALTCSFTSTSSDPDGSIAAYAWTFGDNATSTSQNPSHTYAAGGTFTVTLKVTDNLGATGSVSHTVTLVPVATVTVSLASPGVVVRGTDQATATLKDASGTILTGRAIAWSSNNPSVATVSSSGLVTGVAAGSAT